MWSWAIDDVRSMRLKSGPKGGELSVNPYLEKTKLQVKVLEAGEDAPKKLLVTVTKDPSTLAGRTREVVSNSGESGAQREDHHARQ